MSLRRRLSMGLPAILVVIALAAACLALLLGARDRRNPSKVKALPASGHSVQPPQLETATASGAARGTGRDASSGDDGAGREPADADGRREPRGDLNRDGVVDLYDLLRLRDILHHVGPPP